MILGRRLADAAEALRRPIGRRHPLRYGSGIIHIDNMPMLSD